MTHDPEMRADQDHHSGDAQGGIHHPKTPATGYTGKHILHLGPPPQPESLPDPFCHS
ncbi:MAG: hypothetical protein O3A73_11790 [Proteobacteria bacterium]|nr:hypothetical protein [Pseudomonadota bacterium]